MRTTFGTARRLFVAFAILVSTFAIASCLTLAHIQQMHDSLVQMKLREEGVRLSLELSSAVSDQYAHQAHTIILGDASHLPFYTEAEQRVVALTAQVKQHTTRPDERAWVQDIERASQDLDRVFRDWIVPAVLKHEAAHVQEAHGRAQLLMTLIQDRAYRLVDRFETSSSDYESQVTLLQEATFRWMLFFVVGAPLIAVVVGGYVLRSVARPVARLQEGAMRLAGGDLETRIQIDTDDEFGALARQFNAMTRALKDHQERLVQHEKLAGIGRLAAGVADEINNPLAVILGYARLLRRKAEGALADDLKIIEDETLGAKLIVDGLLDISRMRHVDSAPVDLRAVCDDAVARLAETTVLDGVSVTVSGSGTVSGHPQKLLQVVLNLLKNAAQASGPGGRVEVAVSDAPEGARVVVSDTGQGLSASTRARLFEPFFTTKDGGIGLGLAVSKGIVEAHGGDIEVGATPEGGARFEVRLPTTPPGLDGTGPRPRRRSGEGHDDECGVTSAQFTRLGGPRQDARPA